MASYFTWKDDRGYFKTSTSHIRKILTKKPSCHHVAITKWISRFGWVENMEHLQTETWNKQISQVENAFLWQLVYHVPMTLKYRFRKLPTSDRRTQCTRCVLDIPESTDHYIFSCPTSEDVWQWAHALLGTLTPPSTYFSLTPLHVFLVDLLPSTIPVSTWQILWAIVYYGIWKGQKNHYIPIPPIPCSSSSVISLIWAWFRHYINKEWRELLSTCDTRQRTLEWAAQRMKKQFGDNNIVFSIQNRQISLPQSGPRLQWVQFDDLEFL